MFKLNKKMEYALMALDYVQRNPVSLVTAKEMSENMHLSFDSVARVLQIMSLHLVVISEKGIAGGYRIGPKFEDLNFYELMTIVLGKTDLAKCLTDSGSCSLSATCNIKTPVSRLNEQMIQFYKNLSIQQILHNESDFLNKVQGASL